MTAIVTPRTPPASAPSSSSSSLASPPLPGAAFEAPRGSLATSSLSSPIGELLLAADAYGAAVAIVFDNGHSLAERRAELAESTGLPLLPPGEGEAAMEPLVRQLEEYFSGELRHFELPLRPLGTAFRSRVWSQLLELPFGETCSYGELAQAIGSPKASRAVGAANGANPLPIVVPCHRVLATTGRLHGYGGGLDVKAWLLRHEGVPVDGAEDAQLRLALG